MIRKLMALTLAFIMMLSALTVAAPIYAAIEEVEANWVGALEYHSIGGLTYSCSHTKWDWVGLPYTIGYDLDSWLTSHLNGGASCAEITVHGYDYTYATYFDFIHHYTQSAPTIQWYSPNP